MKLHSLGFARFLSSPLVWRLICGAALLGALHPGVAAAATPDAGTSVLKAVPVVVWPTPAAVPHGTILGSAQLNATADVAGFFTYTPSAGTVMSAGSAQILSVQFVPTDGVAYTTARAIVTINVVQPPPATGALHATVTLAFSAGGHPTAALAQARDGFLFGTTYGGPSGFGTVFRVNGTIATTHTFTGGTDGARPSGTLVQATDWLGYGTTFEGGAAGYGTIFRTESTGALTTLYNFPGSEGRNPAAGIIQGTDGRFYGTTQAGGAYGKGTVFRFLNSALVNDNTNVWTVTTLHNFGGSDGESPSATLVQGNDGRFYGTTKYGGASGVGTIFVIDAAGALTKLYDFDVIHGANPSGRLVQGTDERFYGTTVNGGPSNAGTIFVIDASDSLSTLYAFTGGNDGSNPEGRLIQALDGRLYGTTFAGGVNNLGTVFRLDASGAFTTLHAFSGSDGANPQAGVIQAANGHFYGATSAGGPFGGGVVFRLITITWPTPAAIVYQTALGATQLNATASLPGVFTYTPASGTVLEPGFGQTLSVSFRPTGAPVTEVATASVSIDVLRIVPDITWYTPADIVYGTALGATQLNATANVPGTFTYTPAIGAVLAVGSLQTLSVTFTPDNTAHYDTATSSVSLTVVKATPAIAWPTPSAIAHGTALGTTQLNASTSVVGTFAYSPASGTVLAVGGGQTLSAIFTPSDAANYTTATASVSINVLAPSITVSTTTVTAGSTVTATVANGPGNAQDWVGLYPTGGSTRVSFQFLNGLTSPPATGVAGATLTFTMPAAPGTYELRFFRNNTLTLLATSAAITVTLTTITPGATSVTGGSTVTATIANGPGNAQDWVGLYPMGGSAAQRVSYQFLNGLTSPPATGVTGATLTFTMPAATGSYELRFFRNNTMTLLATSAPITVTAVPTITPGATSVTSGSTVMATIANGPGNAQDWVGLYPVGGSAAQRVSYQFLNGLTSPPATGVTGATLTFRMPTAAGTYELRFFRNNTMTLLATSAPITVTATTITPGATSVTAGSPVTATIANGPGNAQDWVGLYPVGGSAAQRVSYQFLNGLTSPPAAGVTGATLTFTMPAAPGTYELRFFRNNTMTLLATSAPITVTGQ